MCGGPNFTKLGQGHCSGIVFDAVPQLNGWRLLPGFKVGQAGVQFDLGLAPQAAHCQGLVVAGHGGIPLLFGGVHLGQAGNGVGVFG